METRVTVQKASRCKDLVFLKKSICVGVTCGILCFAIFVLLSSVATLPEEKQIIVYSGLICGVLIPIINYFLASTGYERKLIIKEERNDALDSWKSYYGAYEPVSTPNETWATWNGMIFGISYLVLMIVGNIIATGGNYDFQAILGIVLVSILFGSLFSVIVRLITKIKPFAHRFQTEVLFDNYS